MSNENNNEKRDPLLCHWADQMASQIIREKGDLDSYTCASGITQICCFLFLYKLVDVKVDSQWW